MNEDFELPTKRQKIGSVEYHHIDAFRILKRTTNIVNSIEPTISIIQLKELILNNQYLNEHAKRSLFEYIDVCYIANMSFNTLLVVYELIEKHECKIELFGIMNSEYQHEQHDW